VKFKLEEYLAASSAPAATSTRDGCLDGLDGGEGSAAAEAHPDSTRGGADGHDRHQDAKVLDAG
jgi:hypothetical protein